MGFFKRFFKSVLATAVLMGSMVVANGQTGVAPNIRFLETDQVLPAGLWRIRLDGDVFTIDKNVDAGNNFATATTAMSIATNGDVTFPQDIFVTGSATVTVDTTAIGNMTIGDTSTDDAHLLFDTSKALLTQGVAIWADVDVRTTANYTFKFEGDENNVVKINANDSIWGMIDDIEYWQTDATGQNTRFRRPIEIDGRIDATQLIVREHATQTGEVMRVENDTLANMFLIGSTDPRINTGREGFTTTYVTSGNVEAFDSDTQGSESIQDPNDPTTANWAVAGDFSDGTSESVYLHSSGSGTLTQANANLTLVVRDSRWYQFTFTVSNVTDVGAMTAQIDAGTAFGNTFFDVSSAGTRTIYFRSGTNSEPQDLVIRGISDTPTATFTLDTFELKEIQGGDIEVNNAVAWGSDVFLVRDEPWALALRDGGFDNAFRVYATFTDINNWQRLGMYAGSNKDFFIEAQGIGTGQGTIDLDIRSQGSIELFPNFLSAGLLGHRLALNDASLTLDHTDRTGAGVDDSIFFDMTGVSHDGSTHDADWRQFVDMTANDATGSLFTWQTRIDAVAFANAMTLTDVELSLPSASSLDWGGDTKLFRDAPWTLALRDGTNDNFFYVYATHTNSTNYERLAMYAGGQQDFFLEAQTAGTGQDIVNLDIGAEGTIEIFPAKLGSPANFYRFQTGTFTFLPSNTIDFGVLTSGQPRNIYAGTSIFSGIMLTSAGDALTIDSVDLSVTPAQRDSHGILWTGQSFDGSQHDADWRAFVQMAGTIPSSSGVSAWTLENRIDAASFTTVLTAIDSTPPASGRLPMDSSSVTTGTFDAFDTSVEGQQTFQDPNDPSTGNWDVLNDFSQGAGDATYLHSSGSGTLSQIAVNRTLAGEPSRWYRLTYTLTSVTEVGNTLIFMASPGLFSSVQVNLPDSAGTHTVYFLSSSAVVNDPFRITVNSNTVGDGFIIDNLSLVEIQGGDVNVNNAVAWGSDVFLFRDGPWELGLRDGNFDNQFSIYNSFTDQNNYARLSLYSGGGGISTIEAATAGTGQDQQDLDIKANGNIDLFPSFNASPTIFYRLTSTQFQFFPDATISVGIASARALNGAFGGSLIIGSAQTSAVDVLTIDAPNLIGDGQQDSGAIIMTGLGFETATPHDADWKTFVDVTSNAAASTWRLQSRIDAAGFVDKLVVTDAGAMTIAFFNGSLQTETSGSWILLDEVSDTNNPVLIPHKDNTATGIGGSGSQEVTIVVDGSANLVANSSGDIILPNGDLTIDRTDRVGDGFDDSRTFLMTGVAFESATPHDADWLQFVDVTSNAGASTWRLQTRIDAAGFANMLVITDAGDVTVPGGQLFVGAGNTTSVMVVDTTFTAAAVGTVANALDIFPDFTGAGGHTEQLTLMAINGNITTQTATENITSVTSLFVAEPAITDNLTGVIINASTLSVDASPTEADCGGACVNAAILIGIGQTGTYDAIVIDQITRGSGGFDDSGAIIWTGVSFSASATDSDWKAFVNVTTQSGDSTWKLQERREGGAFQDIFTVEDTGTVTLPPVPGAQETFPLFSEKLNVVDGSAEVLDTGSLGSETITDGAFPDSTNWAGAGEWSDTIAGTTIFTFSSTGNGTLTQTSAQRVTGNEGESARWYQVTYTMSSVTDAGMTLTITNAFADTAVTLPTTTGTNIVVFQAHATTAGSADFVMDVTGATGTDTFTMDDLTLFEIQGGDIILAGQITGGGTDGLKVFGTGGVAFTNEGDGSQATDINTTVVANGASGSITTQTATTGIGSSDTFQVDNDRMRGVDDVVILTIQSYSGTLETNGLPVATVTAVTATSFDITIMNVDGTNALNGTFIINYAVINTGSN